MAEVVEIVDYTPKKLAKFDGRNEEKLIYLAIKGKVLLIHFG